MKHRRGSAKKRRIARNKKLVYAPDAQHGLVEIAVSSRVERQVLGRYWNAIQTFLDTGDDGPLLEFIGEDILADDGTLVPLITNLDELERLGYAGMLSFESLYVEGS
jgi:hypothetical protein